MFRYFSERFFDIKIYFYYSSVINTKPIPPKQTEDISFVNDDVVDDIEESPETTTDSTDQLEPIEMSLSSEFKPTIRNIVRWSQLYRILYKNHICVLIDFCQLDIFLFQKRHFLFSLPLLSVLTYY